jgi:peptidoglycan/xylan/chitin deacetylase (PgdA/CDA1 family)
VLASQPTLVRRHMRRTGVLLGLALVAGLAVSGLGRDQGERLDRPPVDALRRSASVATAPAPPLTLPATLPSRYIAVPILMYHRVDVLEPSLPTITRGLTVDPDDFEAQMRWLVSHGYRSITQRQLFEALLRGRRLPSKPVLITFDDGYRNVFGKASPVLRRLGLRATAYVIVGRISNGDPSFLTWGQLRSLERRGVEIGSHTLTHRDLTSLSSSDLRRELLGSRVALARELGHSVHTLAYPYGAYDARVVRMAQASGYVLAVTTRPGTRQAGNAPLELRRIQILDSTGVAGLAAILRGGS